jgi:GntR family transcriptional regulator, transcriptional repressor for pyruvate dehydrogenase complex
MPERSSTVAKKTRPLAEPTPMLGIRMNGGALRALKTSESVARDIVHDIVEAGLQEGERLPGESAMLEQYGVSRESLREGLRLLEVQGLITLRRGPGGGPIVGTVDPANLGRVSSLYYHLAGATYAELFDAWVVDETTIAELAAHNPDRDAVKAAMAPYIDEPDDDTEESVDEFVASHGKFHVVLASLTRNKVLQLSLMVTGQIITHHIVVSADPRDVRDAIDRDHRQIAQAIAGGHVHKAKELMASHIRSVADFYKAQLGDGIYDYIEWR